MHRLKALEQLRRTSLLLCLCVACAHACFAQTGTGQGVYQTPPPSSTVEYNPKAWKVFSSEEGGFSILSPVRLVKRAQPPAAKDARSETYFFEAQTFAVYQVISAIFKEPLAGDTGRVKQLLDNGRDGGVRNVNGQVLEETEIKLEGHAGRALKVRAGNGQMIRSRMYIAGNRFYLVSFMTPDGDVPESHVKFYEEVAAKFLDSFKLTPAQGGARSVPLTDSWARPAEPTLEGEVSTLLKELRERRELVIGPCAGESCQDLSGTSAGGGVEKRVVQKGKINSQVQPEYPAMARAARVSGVVAVQVVVGEEGKVLAAQVISGHPLLHASALKAARKVVFAPTLLDGKPVKTVGVIPFNFALSP